MQRYKTISHPQNISPQIYGGGGRGSSTLVQTNFQNKINELYCSQVSVQTHKGMVKGLHQLHHKYAVLITNHQSTTS